MNHSKRLLRIAEKILADVHFSTQQEFDEYLKNHPNYREDTKFFVNGVQVKAPPREKNNDSSEMTDEQKIIDSMTDEQKKIHSVAIGSFYKWSGVMVDAAAVATHPYTLHKLSENEDERVRKEVARNRHTHPKTLKKLIEDESEKVRAEVAYRSDTPLEIIEKLSDDKSDWVRSSLTFNSNIPFEIMEKLSNDESEDVRSSVALKDYTPLEIIEKLSDDKSEKVRLYLLENSYLSPYIMSKLSLDDESLDVRSKADSTLRAFERKYGWW